MVNFTDTVLPDSELNGLDCKAHDVFGIVSEDLPSGYGIRVIARKNNYLEIVMFNIDGPIVTVRGQNTFSAITDAAEPLKLLASILQE